MPDPNSKLLDTKVLDSKHSPENEHLHKKGKQRKSLNEQECEMEFKNLNKAQQLALLSMKLKLLNNEQEMLKKNIEKCTNRTGRIRRENIVLMEMIMHKTGKSLELDESHIPSDEAPDKDPTSPISASN